MIKERIAYIDNLKVFLTVMVVVHHAGQAYGPTGGVWVVKDMDSMSWLRSFFFLNASYMMGLYFFISGYFSSMSLSQKSPTRFLSDRLRRLGIPLLIFVFGVFGFFHYLNSGTNENYLAYLFELYLHKPPLATGHLWFVASLLAYSLFLLFLPKKSEKKEKYNGPIPDIFILLFLILLAGLSGWIRRYYPIDIWHTWIIPVEPAHLPQYLSLFMTGAYLQRSGRLNAFRTSTSLVYFFLAIFVLLLRPYLPPGWDDFWWFESLIESMLCIGICLGLLEIFRRFFYQSSATMNLLSGNAYGIYLFHLLLVIAWQKILLEVNLAAGVKFIAVSLLGLTSSLLLSFAVRKFKIVRSVI